MRRSAFAGLAVAFALVLSCSSGPARGPVKGRVTMGGAPVTAATVFFENAELGGGMNAPLDSNGEFEVKNYQGAGLPVGTYKVAILPGGVMTPDEAGPKATEAKAARPKANSAIPEKYHKTATSGLTIEVKADSAPFEFDLKP